MKKHLSILLTNLLLASNVFALDLVLKATPGVMFPFNEGYKPGFNLNAQLDADLFGFMTAGIEGNFVYNTTDSPDLNITIGGGGAGLGFYYSPISRLLISAGAAGGLYATQIPSLGNGMGYYWRGYADVGFRLTPEFTVYGSGAYNDYRLYKNGSLNNGFSAGLGLRYTFPLGKKESSVFTTSYHQEDAAFPLFMSAYRNFPVGTLVIRNNEPSELRNVRVSFRAGKYTASTYVSAFIPYFRAHSSEEIPLLADFSSEILKYSENGKISGEIVIDYVFLGKKRQSVQNVVISMSNRNAFYWDDPAALAAFISPDTPEVQQLASNISGIETNNIIPGMNKNFQMAAAMTEGLRLSGIKYSGDKTTPYTEYHLNGKMDEIQYPLQTMNYLGGDYDDIGILLASCLESVGVPTGYMLLKDDFIVLVGMNARAGTEENHFSSADGCVSDDENVYFGISMKNFEKGFIASRKAAAKAIAAAKKDVENPAEYAGTHSAWEIYSPAVFSGSGSNYDYPSKAAVEKAIKSSVDDYINADLADVIIRAKKSGDSNKLGIAYLRSGQISAAKSEFSKSSSIKSMNNLANCYMVEKNYSAAANQYKKVLAKDPENSIAKKGYNLASEKLGSN